MISNVTRHRTLRLCQCNNGIIMQDPEQWAMFRFLLIIILQWQGHVHLCEQNTRKIGDNVTNYWVKFVFRRRFAYERLFT